MDMHQVEARVRRAQSAARHARAQLAEVKSARAHKRDERRARATQRRAIEEDKARDAWADWMAPA